MRKGGRKINISQATVHPPQGKAKQRLGDSLGLKGGFLTAGMRDNRVLGL
jgi:hypothetical protein